MPNTYITNVPTIGGDENTWGTETNANWDLVDDLLDGTTAIKPNLDAGLWKVGGVAVTSTAAELNILDGVTSTTAELNILDGVTSTAAELNVLDGIPGTLTATEIGYLDGVTSAIQTQLDAKQAGDADLTAIAGLASSGLIGRTGAGTAAARTITGTANQIVVADGDGVSGNPTISIAVFTSSAQTITSAGALTLAHGLSAAPTLLQYTLICQTAEGGYSINDVVHISAPSQQISASTTRGASIVVDATNIYVRYCDSTDVFEVVRKDTGVSFRLTNGNWRMVIKAWVI
jgi:hypothetical protein